MLYVENIEEHFDKHYNLIGAIDTSTGEPIELTPELIKLIDAYWAKLLKLD